MPILTAEYIIIAFKKLRDFVKNPDKQFEELIHSAKNKNGWFTTEEVQRALKGIYEMLTPADLDEWFTGIQVTTSPKRIGLVLAGNLPMVGFHDLLCVLATGNKALIKLSSSDDQLLPGIMTALIGIEPLFADRIEYVDRLADFDAVIATGSNNTSRYFEYYFRNRPNIIRKNRTSVAILDGSETAADIVALGHDIFDYYGLGCRNVSKIFIPQDYDIHRFFEPLEAYKEVINHFKYNNNYDYNKSIYLVNLTPHYDNGFILLKEDKSLASPLSVLYYERYKDLDQVILSLEEHKESIQCLVAKSGTFSALPRIDFGKSQSPKLWDYADNVNTVDFLNKHSQRPLL